MLKMWFSLKETVAPQSEPITVAEVKDHLRISNNNEDDLIRSLITSERKLLEENYSIRLLTQTWEYKLDAWPRGVDCIEIPFYPVASISSITYIDSDGNSQTWSASEYDVDVDSRPPRIALDPDYSYPNLETARIKPITITLIAGYGSDGSYVPDPILSALRMMVGHRYENREATSFIETEVRVVPLGVDSLMSPYRQYGF